MNSVAPTTRLRPGLNMKLTSRTSLVARAIVSPTGWRLWKVMLLPSRETYNSSRISRSTRWAISSAPKLRPNCSTPRTICEPPRIRASGMRALRTGCGLSMSLKALPTRTGMAAAERGVANGADEQHEQDGPVTQGVRPDPKRGAARAHGGFTFEGEFRGGGEGGHGRSEEIKSPGKECRSSLTNFERGCSGDDERRHPGIKRPTAVRCGRLHETKHCRNCTTCGCVAMQRRRAVL